MGTRRKCKNCNRTRNIPYSSTCWLYADIEDDINPEDFVVADKCPHCGSEEYEDNIDYPDEYFECMDELEYIMDKLFDKRRPDMKDEFGSIEMCDLLKKEYNLDDSVYELIYFVDRFMIAMRHVEMCYGEEPSSSSKAIELSDGRRLQYSYYRYSNKINDLPCTYLESRIQKAKENPRKVLLRIIDVFKSTKPAFYGDPEGDFSYSLEDLKLAREKYEKFRYEKRKREKEQELFKHNNKTTWKKKHPMGFLIVLIIIFNIFNICIQLIPWEDFSNSGSSGSSGSSISSIKCQMCGREFNGLSNNAKSIRRTNMCTNCYTNYKEANELPLN